MLVLFCVLVALLLSVILRYRRINGIVGDIPYVSLEHSNIQKIKNGDVYEIATQISNSYERLGKAWIGSKLFVFIDHPDDLRTILNSKDCLDKPYAYGFIKAGDGLLTSDCKTE